MQTQLTKLNYKNMGQIQQENITVEIIVIDQVTGNESRSGRTFSIITKPEFYEMLEGRDKDIEENNILGKADVEIKIRFRDKIFVLQK